MVISTGQILYIIVVTGWSSVTGGGTEKPWRRQQEALDSFSQDGNRAQKSGPRPLLWTSEAWPGVC